MLVPQHRVILDTNILVRGLINLQSASGRIVDACDRRSVVLILSRPILTEYRAVLTDSEITQRYPELTVQKIEIALRRLKYVADFFHPVRERFEYPRDPQDSKLIELAIAGQATHIVTNDKDLLSLPAGHGDAARRFRQRLPGIEVLEPAGFVHRYYNEL